MIPFTRTHQGASTLAPPGTASQAVALRLSVVIPTCRRADLLSRCLAALFAQRIERGAFEVIVVDDGHTSDTEALVDAFRSRPDAPVMRFLRPRRGRGPAVARNAGWRAAYGPLIAFTDDDAIPTPDWLANGERAFAEGLVAISGRVSVPRSDGGDAAAGLAAAGAARTARGLGTAGFVSTNVFVRRSALLTVGGFDERFQREWPEDSDLQFRLIRDAGPVGRCEDAVVVHPVRSEPWGACLRQQQNAFFEALLFKKHPELYRKRTLGAPPWDHYGIVALSLAAPALWVAGIDGSAVVSFMLAGVGVLRLAVRRLRHTARAPDDVAGMVATSVLIPFLSVYWRLRGAIHFRVLFL